MFLFLFPPFKLKENERKNKEEGKTLWNLMAIRFNIRIIPLFILQ